MGVGSLIGVAAGWITTLIMRKDWLPVSLHKFGVLALVLVTFTLSDWLSHESGLLAVTVFGIWLANQEGLDLEEVLAFKEDLAVILISSLFILLAARLDLAQLWQLGPMVLVLLCVVQFVAPTLHPGLDPGIGSPLARPGPARLDSPPRHSGGGGQRLLRHQHERGRY